MTTKTRSGSGSRWAWLPVLATILLATLVPGIPEERGTGRADAQVQPTNTPIPPTGTSTPGPTSTPTNTPVDTPTFTPTSTPTDTPTTTPTYTPTNTPTNTPTYTPTSTPTDTPTVTPTFTPTVTPTVTPTTTPVPTAAPDVDLGATTAVPGQALLASGSVPDTYLSYQLCLIANATWTLGSPFGGVCTLSAPLTSPTIAFSGVPLGSAPGAGSYDLLLLGPTSTVLAADDASAAPGLVVTGLANVPVGGRAGLLGFAFLIAAGAWVLLRQFR